MALIGEAGLTLLGVACVGWTCFAVLVLLVLLSAVAWREFMDHMRGGAAGSTPPPGLPTDDRTPRSSSSRPGAGEAGSIPGPGDSGTPAASSPCASAPQGPTAQGRPHPVASSFNTQPRAASGCKQQEQENLDGSLDTALVESHHRVAPTGGARKERDA